MQTQGSVRRRSNDVRLAARVAHLHSLRKPRVLRGAVVVNSFRSFQLLTRKPNSKTLAFSNLVLHPDGSVSRVPLRPTDALPYEAFGLGRQPHQRFAGGVATREAATVASADFRMHSAST